MKISHLDHIVLTVNDIEHTCQFYQQNLGISNTTFGIDRVALHIGKQKINLHQKGKEFEPKANNVTPGSADFCFITDTPLTEVIKHLIEYNIDIIEGPVERIGASGLIKSIYIYDPDGNLIEISNQV